MQISRQEILFVVFVQEQKVVGAMESDILILYSRNGKMGLYITFPFWKNSINDILASGKSTTLIYNANRTFISIFCQFTTKKSK